MAKTVEVIRTWAIKIDDRLLMVPDIKVVNDKPYARLSKRADWLSTLLTGAKAYKTPIGKLTVWSLLRERLRDQLVKLEAPAQSSGSSPSSSSLSASPSVPLSRQLSQLATIASLGLDDDDDNDTPKSIDDEDDDSLRAASPRPAKRRRHALSVHTRDMPIAVDVPAALESDLESTITLLSKTDRDAVWMLLEPLELEWLRGYVLSELGVTPLDDQASHSTPKKAHRQQFDVDHVKHVYWCSAVSSWRVEYKDTASHTAPTLIKSFFVRRNPAATFDARVNKARAVAQKFLESSHVFMANGALTTPHHARGG
jgi:hypothetical protein